MKTNIKFRLNQVCKQIDELEEQGLPRNEALIQERRELVLQLSQKVTTYTKETGLGNRLNDLFGVKTKK